MYGINIFVCFNGGCFMKRFVLLFMIIMSFAVCSSVAGETIMQSKAKKYNGHKYLVVEEKCTWSEAKDKCKAAGGHLVTITSADEQKFVEQLIKGKVHFWIGMYRGADNEFFWITDEKVEYSNWGRGEPNNTRGIENAVGLRPDWNDYNENDGASMSGFVCEWDDISVDVDSVIKKHLVKSFNNHMYQIFREKCSWSEAEERCEAAGGHLVTITSGDEQDFVEKMQSGNMELWIGMRRGSDDQFYWITGEKSEYSHWRRGEPNNYGTGENSVAMCPEWNDYNDNNIANISGYICEWDSCEIVRDTDSKNNVVLEQYVEEDQEAEKEESDNRVENDHEQSLSMQDESTIVDEENTERNGTEVDGSDEYDKEIVFRGIPWGTSMAELEKMKMFDYFGSYDSSMPFEENFATVPDWRLAFGGTEFHTGHKAICAVYGDGLKVGGYKVTGINLYCMYGTKYGALNREKDASQFFAADYEFDPIDYKAAYYNLQEKLTDLYGEGEVKTESAESFFLVDKGCFDYTQIGVITIWNGKNDTHVLLFGSWIENESQYENDVNEMTRNLVKNLYITYYQGGKDQQLRYINTMEQELEKKEENNNAEGYEGL